MKFCIWILKQPDAQEKSEMWLTSNMCKKDLEICKDSILFSCVLLLHRRLNPSSFALMDRIGNGVIMQPNSVLGRSILEVMHENSKMGRGTFVQQPQAKMHLEGEEQDTEESGNHAGEELLKAWTSLEWK